MTRRKRAVTLATLVARFDAPCPCGRMILAGDDIAGPVNGRWLHLDCARRGYALAGHRLDLQPVSSQTPAPANAGRLSHRQVNGARLYCPTCGGRIILGRDGTPVRTRDGRYRHGRCPDPVVTRRT